VLGFVGLPKFSKIKWHILLKALPFPFRYNIMFVGHSLGAGIAALAAGNKLGPSLHAYNREC
jgi:hypothetical protein